MKKIFQAEYGDELADDVREWIKGETMKEDGTIKIYRPYVTVELFNQYGSELK